ncbi:MAG: DsbE family thiol:disulfide interchange protein [Proteobacteria bacterium]|nr:DsbE family thiol:disulfide interchange protein [Pseudomonadota bacterium]
MVRRLGYILPLGVMAILTVWFSLGLMRDPQYLPSALINSPVPEFSLAAIEGQERGFSSADIKGHVSLVNVFGSWCVACREEHPFLMQLKRDNVMPIYGIDWREENRQAGPRWLKRFGNPYTLIGDDPKSIGAIAFGVTVAPETFIIDKTGVIRYKHQGPITPQNWGRTLFPIIEKLRAE